MACLAASTTTAHPNMTPAGKTGTCDSKSIQFHRHRARVLLKHAYSGTVADKELIGKAQRHKLCIFDKDVKAQIAALRERLKAQLEQRQAITPFEGPNGTRWAIPWSIVACESGGDFGARNSSSSAGGAYQVLNTTWLAYGGTDYPDSHPAAVAPPDEQHLIASRIWAGGSGRGQWEC